MCGIAGFFDFGGRFGSEALLHAVQAMADVQRHRGPDDSGAWIDPSGRCALAHRRLSILDLSPLGHQPMLDAGGRIGLTYNGEIYNHRELRADLESQGRRFRSHSDTEVLLHLLDDFAPERLAHLRGMYAFGAFDVREGRLFLARDDFGKKPLYVARGRGWLAFASELRALEVIGELDRTIEAEALAEYFLVQYVHAPSSIYRGVEKLPPGSWLSVDASGRERSGSGAAFHAGGATAGVSLAPTYEGRLEQLDARIREAVELRLVADVPLGAFLSGGVDSALVVATMRRLGVRPRTFAVGFRDSPDSEHEAARAFALQLGCEHHDIEVRPDAIELAPSIAAALDEPNGDSSCLPTRLLSEFVRNHVTVALSGDGGDELFGGYGRYFDVLGESGDPPLGGRFSASQAYLGPRWTIFQPSQVQAFLGALPTRAGALLEEWAALLERPDRTLLQRMRTLDAATYLPGSVLAKVDRMSMLHSLEVRCPLLDREVARFAAALADDDCLCKPGDHDGRRIAGKRMLKDLLARDVPRAWVDRRKTGFGLPASFWDGAGLRRFAVDLLDAHDTRLRDHVDRAALRTWIDTQQDPHSFSIYRLWPMLILELWLRRPRQQPVL